VAHQILKQAGSFVVSGSSLNQRYLK
jgi:hypothetical protein